MDGSVWLEEVVKRFTNTRELAERASAQASDEDFFRSASVDANSLAVLHKHLGGNLRSRWKDFLTTDGEKPDRNRDGEFEIRATARGDIEAVWSEGWNTCLDSLRALSEEDLERTVTIRSEPWSVVAAIQRSLGHADYHTGQIVQLARHWVGDGWQSLSIPRGRSQEFLDGMRQRFGH